MRIVIRERRLEDHLSILYEERGRCDNILSQLRQITQCPSSFPQIDMEIIKDCITRLDCIKKSIDWRMSFLDDLLNQSLKMERFEQDLLDGIKGLVIDL